jgi:very-short-patch-repair endonuclease
MTKSIWLLVIIGVVAIVVDLLSKKDKLKKVDNFFVKKDYLLNIPERNFFELLQKLLPVEYVCYPQINLRSIVKVNSSRKLFQSYQNSIDRKIIDFVIFRKQYLEPTMVIEYDGSTHNLEKRIDRDNKVDNVLKTAGINYIHVHHGDANLENFINNEILTKLKY